MCSVVRDAKLHPPTDHRPTIQGCTYARAPARPVDSSSGMAPLKSPLTASEAKANRVDSDRRRSSQTHKGVLGPHSSHNSFLTDSSKTLVLRISARYHIVRASILSMKHVHCVVHEAGRERATCSVLWASEKPSNFKSCNK